MMKDNCIEETLSFKLDDRIEKSFVMRKSYDIYQK